MPHGPKSGRRAAFAAAAALAALGIAGCGRFPSVATHSGATAVTAAMQDRGVTGAAKDNAIGLEINHYWLQRAEELIASLQTQIYEGRVLVTGMLSDPALAAEAIELARRADGVREIIDEIQIAPGGLKTYARDTWLAGELRSRLMLTNGVKHVNYSVQVVNGTAYILGLWTTPAEHDLVLRQARAMAGIRRVTSHAIGRDDPRRWRAASAR